MRNSENTTQPELTNPINKDDNYKPGGEHDGGGTDF